jgi:hypothetical protein
VCVCVCVCFASHVDPLSSLLPSLYLFHSWLQENVSRFSCQLHCLKNVQSIISMFTRSVRVGQASLLAILVFTADPLYSLYYYHPSRPHFTFSNITKFGNLYQGCLVLSSWHMIHVWIESSPLSVSTSYKVSHFQSATFTPCSEVCRIEVLTSKHFHVPPSKRDALPPCVWGEAPAARRATLAASA